MNIGLRKFARAGAGNVAMLYAIALVPCVGAAGAAIDLGQAVVLRQRLAETADMAALALGSMPGLTDAQKHAKALEFFAANFPESKLGEATTVTVSSTDRTITVAANGKVPTAFMQIFGMQELDVGVEAEVTLEGSKVEIALALDNTGSMGGSGKLDALKSSMTSMINVMFGQDETSSKVKMGLVPFSEAVRLDPEMALAGGWIDTKGKAKWATKNFDNGKGALEIWSMMDPGSPQWAGCVEARPNGLEETDTPPNQMDPDTLWVPYFQPDEPDDGEFANSYLPDGAEGPDISNDHDFDHDDDVTKSKRKRFKSSLKYVGVNTGGPNTDCTMQKVLPLTNSKPTLLSYVDGMQATGYTHIAVGAAWGWRLLSPGEPYTEGAAYGKDANKILVLMTDGVNTIPEQGSFLKSNYTAYGYLDDARLDTTDANAARLEQNARTATVCTRAKALGIRIYTILLMEDNGDVRNLLRECASSPQMFFDSPSTADLDAAFQQIAAELSNLRLSR